MEMYWYSLGGRSGPSGLVNGSVSDIFFMLYTVALLCGVGCGWVQNWGRPAFPVLYLNLHWLHSAPHVAIFHFLINTDLWLSLFLCVRAFQAGWLAVEQR